MVLTNKIHKNKMNHEKHFINIFDVLTFAVSTSGFVWVFFTF